MTTVRTRTRAPILEVFASIQGEGAYAGEPQTFVRLAGCPLRCRWCDTPGSWSPDRPESDVDEVAQRVADVEGVRPRTVSITGGEPLAHPEFVAELARTLAPRRIHLETAGAHPRALERLIDHVDHTSLDLKLPADLDAPQPWRETADELPDSPETWRQARRHALSACRGHDACGKIVLAGGRTPDEIAPLVEDVLEIHPTLPLILQPVTPIHGVEAPTAAELLRVVESIRACDLDVRVLPQIHRALRLP